MVERNVKVKTFKVTVDDEDLENFLNSVDPISVYTVMRSMVVNKDNIIGADDADRLLFGGEYPRIYGGPPEKEVVIYGTLLKVVYREKC